MVGRRTDCEHVETLGERLDAERAPKQPSRPASEFEVARIDNAVAHPASMSPYRQGSETVAAGAGLGPAGGALTRPA